MNPATGNEETQTMSTKRRRRRIGVALPLLVCAVVLLALPSASISQVGPLAAGDPGTVVCTTGPTFNLTTATGRISTPDGNSLYMWGYANAGGAFQMPGPVLCVNQGDTVTVRLTNNVVPERVSIVFPGQTGVSATGGVPGLFTNEAGPGDGTVTYTFTAGEPGTYIYESGTNQIKQIQMGLYGALIVRPSGHPDWAYNSARTAFDPSREYLLLLHEIDPDLHYAVENNLPYDITAVHDRYWTINGRSFPDTVADNGAPWLPSQPYGSLVTVEASDPANPGLPALVRYANAGMYNHPFHPHGNHLRVIARDGRLLQGLAGEDTSMEAFSKTIGSGQTADLLFWWLNLDAWSSSGNPLPVQVPGLQNLVFKDGLTFYSGSPYLGEKDELPVGTTTFSQCGEFYFPWHSHALEEVQNFNEGFGGLMTLVRVDPPGGCP